MKAVFAIPGDKDRRTGGFIYEATVLRELNALGHATQHMELPDSFPDPTPEDMAETLAMLRGVPASCPLILDGLVFGSIDPEGLATVRAPLIAMIHHPLGLETGVDAARAQVLLRNEAAALQYAAHVIVPSPHTARILAHDFGVDPAKLTIAQPGFNRPAGACAPADPPLILSVGLLAPRKGHDILLDALARIQDLPWQAEIVGRAHDMDTDRALAQQCERLGLSERVHFMGELAAARLDCRFRAASVFALATRYEGYGMVLSEAMLYGLPVVSCTVGAVPETVGEAGVLVPAQDAGAFADGLRRALRDREKLGALSLDKSRSLPTWRQTAGHFITVLEAFARQKR